MKKQLTAAAALACMCLLTSCGSMNQAATSEARSDNAAFSVNHTKGESLQAEPTAGDEAYEAYDDAEYYENTETSELSFRQSNVRALNPQMLVYSCEMSIDVLEFDESVDKFHDLIKKYKGFVESETYSDGGNSSKWQYEDAQKWKTLHTVIRIPSASYDDFCDDAENVGDMRRKNASVQNLTTEYSDLKTTLSIYEAKEKRYIDLLAAAKNESDAIAVENELTNIQVEIARIKTRMNNIENDAAYSYINLTLNEVREYTEDPVIEKTDTFGQRLTNTLSKTWKGFLVFLEDLLFFIIRVLPYLLVLGIFLFIITRICRAVKRKKRASRAAAQYPVQMNTQPEKQNAPENAEQKDSEEPQKETETDQK